jgi:hypothetical protein
MFKTKKQNFAKLKEPKQNESTLTKEMGESFFAFYYVTCVLKHETK